jgi:hypothetical protein
LTLLAERPPLAECPFSPSPARPFSPSPARPFSPSEETLLPAVVGRQRESFSRRDLGFVAGELRQGHGQVTVAVLWQPNPSVGTTRSPTLTSTEWAANDRP